MLKSAETYAVLPVLAVVSFVHLLPTILTILSIVLVLVRLAQEPPVQNMAKKLREQALKLLGLP